jgi:membrane protein
MKTTLTLAKRSLQSFQSDKCATLAAAIAYHAVFALFPIALLGVALLGFFIGGAAARQQVVEAITRVIPLGESGTASLSATLLGLSRASGWLGVLGLLGTAWSASGLFASIRSALDSVWDVDRPLPPLRAKAQDLLVMLGFGGLLIAASASTGLLVVARQSSDQLWAPLAQLATPLFLPLSLLLPLLLTVPAFMVLYRLAPHVRLHWADVWPAAAISALFFAFGQNLLALYLAHLGHLNALVGSLGAAILVLVFISYSAEVGLLAAEFAKHRLLVRAGAVPATDAAVPRAPSSRLQQLTGMLVRLWTVGQAHHDPGLPYHPGRLEPVRKAPTNTREAVLYRQGQAQEHAAQDADRTSPAQPALAAAERLVTPGKAGSADEAVVAGDVATRRR